MVILSSRAERSVKGVLPHLLKKSPHAERGWSERQKAYARYLKQLKSKSPGLLKEAIALRQRIKKTRLPIAKGLEQAVEETRKRFPQFKGILLFGSFSRGKEKPRDIDFVFVWDSKIHYDTVGVDDFLFKRIRELSKVRAEERAAWFLDLRHYPEDPVFSIHAQAEVFVNLFQEQGKKSKTLDNLFSWNFIGDKETAELMKKALG